MSKPIDDGGSAFPMPTCVQCGVLHEPHHKDSLGMTLRDYFAAKALVCAPDGDLREMCAWAFKVADAMIAERNRVPS